MSLFTVTRLKELTASIKWRAEFAHAIARAILRRPLLKDVKFVAITGSAGKTTTKDLCAGILSFKGSVTKTDFSSNEPAMVAETITAIRSDNQYAVLEVSGGHPKAMDWPLRLFTPTIAVVTLIQREHAQPGFGLEEIAAEKFRLINALPQDGTGVINIDDPLLRKLGQQCNKQIIWIGREEGATLRLLDSHSRWPQPLTLQVSYKRQSYNVVTRLHGEHLALSVLSALAVALASGIELTEAIDYLQNVEPSEGRMQIVPCKNNVTFLRDDWKAPLWSLDAPMMFMKNAQAQRKIIVIGTLSDYSRSASKLYPQVAQKALDIADLAIFVGPHAHRATKKAKSEQQERLHGFSEASQASAYLRETLQPGDLVLLKGSSRVDHLVRLMLDQQKPVACWDSRCGKSQFCTRCPRLYDFDRLGTSIPNTPVSNAIPSPALIKCKEESIVLIGLGNPGERYYQTRHNAGQFLLDTLARDHGMTWVQNPLGQTAEGSLHGAHVLLVKPHAAINNSGDVISRMLGSETVTHSAVIIHDDMDLPLGAVKVRHAGGDSGHLGVRSIITACQTQDFKRMRVGVRPHGDNRKSRQLVHQRFSPQELKQMMDTFSSRLQQLLSDAQKSAVIESSAIPEVNA